MSTVVTVPTLIDLSLGTGDVGKVNFGLLHSLMHIMVQQLDLREVKVDFRGPDSEKIQALLKEGRADTGVPPELVPDATGETKGEAGSQKDDDAASVITAKKKQSIESEIVYVVESGKVVDMKKDKLIQPTPSTIARLEAKMRVLQTQIETLGEQVLPSNEALLEATRTQNEARPITAIWHNLNITKRMSGAEEGIDKLASLLETVAKEYADLKSLIDHLQDECGDDFPAMMRHISQAAKYARQIRPREEMYMDRIIKPVKGIAELVAVHLPEDRAILVEAQETHEEVVEVHHHEGVGAVGGEEGEWEEGKGEATTPQHDQGSTGYEGGSRLSDVILPLEEGQISTRKINKLVKQHERLRNNVEYITAQINTLADFADIILPEILQGLPQMEELKHRIAKIRGKTGSEVTLTEEELEERRAQLSVEQRLEDMEKCWAKHWAMLRRQDAMICERSSVLASKIGSLENDLNLINKRLHIGMDDEDEAVNEELRNNPVIREIAAVGEELSANFKDISKTIEELIEDRDANEDILKEMGEAVELMRNVKADRFEMDDILSEKADCHQLDEKVSQEEFDAACTNLNEADQQTQQRIDEQEELFKEIVKHLEEVLDTKFDREELIPLKEYIDTNFKEINEKIERLLNIKEGKPAAGTKKQLIKNVNCVCCDQEAVMYTEDTPGKLKPQRCATESISPFIAFEVNYLRQLQAKNPSCKNLIQYEDIMKRYAQFKTEQEEGANHIVNRYVGGSHTLLGPQTKIIHPAPENQEEDNKQTAPL